MITYVTTYSGGFRDCTYRGILYAGNDYNKALGTILDFKFPDSYNNWGAIEYWEDGKHIRDQEFDL